MADFWTAPKVNWTDSDGIGYADLNRIEQNTEAVRDGTKRRVQGFGYSTFNDNPAYDGYIVIETGSCYSENGVPINATSYFTKNLTAWQQGNGVAFGCLAPGAVISFHKWMYLFVISNPIDGSVEYMLDDNVSGNNIASVVYTEKRYINCFKTQTPGTHSSFTLVEMYSTGDYVFINPMSPSTQGAVFTTGGQASNVYVTQQLVRASSVGTETPLNRNVLAQFDLVHTNCDIGIYSLVHPYTIPTNFITLLMPNAEISIMQAGRSGIQSDQFMIRVDAGSQISLALVSAGGAGWVEFRCNMFYDDRLWLS